MSRRTLGPVPSERPRLSSRMVGEISPPPRSVVGTKRYITEIKVVGDDEYVFPVNKTLVSTVSDSPKPRVYVASCLD